MAQGLLGTTILALAQDDRGFLWLVHPNGVVRLEKRELNEVIQGRRKKITSWNVLATWSEHQPLGTWVSAAARLSNERLWLATDKYLMVLDANAPQLPPPHVVIDQFTHNGKTMDATSKLVIDPGRSNIEIQYRAVTLRGIPALRYRYRLAGRGEPCTDAYNQTIARYSGMAPGTHRFEVSASRTATIWSPSVALTFEILAPIYQRSWFLAAAGFCLLGGLFALYRFRVGQQTMRHQVALGERSRLARNIHDTLAQGLVATILQLRCAQKALATEDDRDAALRYVARAEDAVDAGLKEARGMIAGLRPTALSHGDFIAALQDVGRQVAVQSSVPVRVEGNVPPLPQAIQEDLLMIAKEAMTNAVRHASPTQVVVRLQLRSSLLKLQVRDDGKGFDVPRFSQDSQEHYGILGMHERAQAIGAKLFVESTPGEGTVVRLELTLS
jgi:signal transduction histidine kinase